MKVVLEYKKSWWYARFRKLKIYMSEKVFLTEMKQGERKEVEIPENIEYIYGRMDWGKTERLKIQSSLEGKCIEIVPFFTLNTLRQLGLMPLPIKFSVNDENSK